MLTYLELDWPSETDRLARPGSKSRTGEAVCASWHRKWMIPLLDVAIGDFQSV